MTSIAEIVRQMLAAGLPHETIVSAVERMEAGDGHRSRAQQLRSERNRRYYERKKAGLEDAARLAPSHSDVEETKQDALKTHSDDLQTAQDRRQTVSDDRDAVPRERAGSNILPPSGDIKNPPSEGKKIAAAIPTSLIGEAIDAWNTMAAGIGRPQVASRTDKRAKAVRAILVEHGLPGWRRALDMVAASGFLNGSNAKGWAATFDWLTVRSNFAKVIEGNYAKPSDGPAARPGDGDVSREQWSKRLKYWSSKGEWFEQEGWGPPPGRPGCRAPPDLVEALKPTSTLAGLPGRHQNAQEVALK